MYFLSKNMCFLRIMSIFCAKPKKSGPADDFFAFFHLRPPDGKHCAPSPALSSDFAKDIAPQRWFALFSRHLPAHRNSTTDFEIYLVLINSYLIRFNTSFVYQSKSRFDQSISLWNKPKTCSNSQPVENRNNKKEHHYVFADQNIYLIQYYFRYIFW